MVGLYKKVYDKKPEGGLRENLSNKKYRIPLLYKISVITIGPSNIV